MEKYVGCSGWHYKDWKERFYPEGLAQKDWLSYYAETFSSVEINATFYKIPQEKTFQKWKAETPDEFRFSLKGSRYVTHLKKLKEVAPYVKEFYDSIEALREKCACVLWQLPGNFKKTENNQAKLEAFLKTLSSDHDNVIEFRDASWFDRETRELLQDHSAIPCSVSSSFDVPELLEVSNGRAYLRFHGKGKELYKYFYSEEELQEWAEAVLQSGAEKVYAYFNNDYYAHGPMNGISFRTMLERAVPQRA